MTSPNLNLRLIKGPRTILIDGFIVLDVTITSYMTKNVHQIVSDITVFQILDRLGRYFVKEATSLRHIWSSTLHYVYFCFGHFSTGLLFFYHFLQA